MIVFVKQYTPHPLRGLNHAHPWRAIWAALTFWNFRNPWTLKTAVLSLVYSTSLIESPNCYDSIGVLLLNQNLYHCSLFEINDFGYAVLCALADVSSEDSTFLSSGGYLNRLEGEIFSFLEAMCPVLSEVSDFAQFFWEKRN